MPLFNDLRGVEAWPERLGPCEGARDKARLRHKLQPLPRLPPCAAPLSPRFDGYAAAEGGRQPLFGAAAQEARPGSASMAFVPQVRPGTAPRAPPPLGRIGFPARLDLRGPGETVSTPGPWAAPREALVLPLDTQSTVRLLVDVCGAERREVLPGSRLTLWALSEEEGTATSMEPVAAWRAERGTMAVEPVEFVLERTSGERGGNAVGLRYGECFRLRAADRELYLGHGSDGGALRCSLGGSAQRGLRFAAHGGELGAPLLLGRPLALQRVRSPEPESASEASSESESESDRSYCSGEPRRQSRRRRSRRPVSSAAPEGNGAAAATQVPHGTGSAGDGGALLSRLADVSDGVFRAALLPPPTPGVRAGLDSILGACSGWSAGYPTEASRAPAKGPEEDDEIFSMDMILTELRRQLREEQSGAAVQKHGSRDQALARVAELEARIAQGERLRSATREALAKNKQQVP